jgi:ABC-type transporter Mla subunit MlaD
MREPTNKQLLQHLHKLAHENAQVQEQLMHILRRTFRKVGKIMSIQEDLTREIQETKDAVGVVAARMQELIDQLASQPALTAAAQAAVDGLNEIQTTLAALAAPATPTP